MQCNQLTFHNGVFTKKENPDVHQITSTANGEAKSRLDDSSLFAGALKRSSPSMSMAGPWE